MNRNTDTPPYAPSAFAGSGEILFRSALRKIGKHEWRVTVYRHGRYGAVVGYEWRRAAETIMGRNFPPDPYWQHDVNWPRYDHNDGQYAGMPRTLARLYDAHRVAIARHLIAA